MTEELAEKRLRDDERPVDRAALDMLDQDKLQQYILQKSVERPGFAQLTPEQAREMLNLTRNGIPTLAAILNFCIYPQGYFPQLAITAIVVPGTEIGDTASDSARFVDNKRIDGTIPAMVEGALSFCKRNMRTRTIISPETGACIDRTEYPLDALREAILNAVIHCDYSIYSEGTPVQIDFFTDRLEIHSPGTLYGRMSVEQLGIARPDLRNPALAVMAETLTGAENRYSGIPTMRRAMQAYGLPEPKFENRRNEFVVTFYNTSAPQQVSQQQTELPQAASKSFLEFCRTPRSRQEIADYLGVKTVFYVMKHYIEPLLQSGWLAMTMPEKPKSRNQRYVTACQNDNWQKAERV